MQYMGPYETILAAPLQGVANDGSPWKVTLAVNEPGHIDLARMWMCVSQDGAVLDSALQITDLVEIQAITLNGSQIYVRARNSPGAPGGILSAMRAGALVDLPIVQVTSGDTVEITGVYSYAGGLGHAQVACPMFPARFATRGQPGQLGIGSEVIVASPKTAVVDNTSTAVVITADNPGIIDMSRLVISGNLPPTANIQPTEGAKLELVASVNQIIVRSDYNMVVGQGGALSAPAAAFASLRQRHWVDLGRHQVVPGDSITLTLHQQTGVAAVMQASVPMIPTDGSYQPGTRHKNCGC